MIVLDASALLALIKQEPGWDVVATAAAVEAATVSSVNYSETLQKAARLGVQPELVDSRLDALGITVSQFGRLDARLAASFYRHGSNLSLGDRACLALARNLSSAAYTADRDWLNWASSRPWKCESSVVLSSRAVVSGCGARDVAARRRGRGACLLSTSAVSSRLRRA